MRPPNSTHFYNRPHRLFLYIFSWMLAKIVEQRRFAGQLELYTVINFLCTRTASDKRKYYARTQVTSE